MSGLCLLIRAYLWFFFFYTSPTYDSMRHKYWIVVIARLYFCQNLCFIYALVWLLKGCWFQGTAKLTITTQLPENFHQLVPTVFGFSLRRECQRSLESHTNSSDVFLNAHWCALGWVGWWGCKDSERRWGKVAEQISTRTNSTIHSCKPADWLQKGTLYMFLYLNDNGSVFYLNLQWIFLFNLFIHLRDFIWKKLDLNLISD